MEYGESVGGPSNDNWLGTPAAAEHLGLNQSTDYKLVDEGLIVGYKLGRVLRFRREDLDAYLSASRVVPGELSLDPPIRFRARALIEGRGLDGGRWGSRGDGLSRGARW